MPEEKFAPPPTNIVIRTMEKDIQALQQGGGEFPVPAIPEQPAQPPIEDAFLQQQIPAEQMPANYQFPPPPAPPMPPASMEPAMPMPSQPIISAVPEEKKSFFSNPLVLALGGIVILFILGAIGFFVVLPAVRTAFAPAPEIPAPEIPAPIPQPQEVIPLPALIAPAVILARPADATVTHELTTTTPAALLSLLAGEAAQPSEIKTLKTVLVTSEDGTYVPSTEALALLFNNNAPMALVSAADGNAYTLFLYRTSADTVHLGAYFSLNPVAAEAASAAIRAWEQTLPADARMFFLGKPAGAMQETFRDGRFRNFPLRFAIFGAGLAINYAVAENTFIITTHYESMFEAIRRLTGAE